MYEGWKKHVRPAVSSAIAAALVGSVYYLALSRPVEVLSIDLAKEQITRGEDVVLYYRVRRIRECKSILHVNMYDGVDTKEVYTTTLHVSDNARVPAVERIQLPAEPLPERIRLFLKAEFHCNRLHTWWPLTIELGDYTVILLNDEESKIKQDEITYLKAQVNQLTMKVFTLSLKVQKLETQKDKRKTENIPDISKTKAQENRLRAEIPQDFTRVLPKPRDTKKKSLPKRVNAQSRNEKDNKANEPDDHRPVNKDLESHGSKKLIAEYTVPETIIEWVGEIASETKQQWMKLIGE